MRNVRKMVLAATMALTLSLSLCVPAGAVVSGHDQKNLTPKQQEQVKQATKDFEKAQKSGDQAGMDAAHKAAEKVRSEANYSGGADGSEYHPWGSGGSSGGGGGGGGSYSPPPPTYYTITATAGAHGSITPAGTTSLVSGSSQTYTITPVYGYSVADVLVDGVSVGAKTSHTISNLSSNRTISATFKTEGKVSVGNGTLTDQDGKTFSQFKAGYGFEAKIDLDMQYATITSATAKMSNGDTYNLELVGSNQLQFVKNPNSPINARKYYVPVTTKDGTFSVTFTIKSKDTEGVALPDATKTYSFTIKGSMYDDDHTAPGKKK